MKIKILAVGKTDDKNLQVLVDTYVKRLAHYVKFELEIIPDLKKMKSRTEAEQKTLEGEALLKKLEPGDQLVLLDEKGRQYRSMEFASQIQKKMNSGVRRMVLVIGGPYGFSDAVYARADELLSRSKITFTHQMIRLCVVDQVYRAFTILRNEPYHHE